jgi:excisionase family DNA binding protein
VLTKATEESTMPPVLLTARELAQRLDVSYDAVVAWARRDVIPSIRDSRSRRWFNLDSVLAALRSGDDINSDRMEATR